jgi:uncharacterized protein YggE
MDFTKIKEHFHMCHKTVISFVLLFAVLLALLMGIKVVKELVNFDHNGKGQSQVQNTINVSGTGEVYAKPDVATISLGVNEEAKSVVDAQNKATAKMNAAIKVLKDNGVDEKDIKTTNYSIYPRYDYVKTVLPQTNVYGIEYYPSSKQVLAAYVVSQDLNVKIRDIAKAGDILAKVGELGLNNVSGLSFIIDKEDALKDSARDLAIADGKTKAKELAKQLGVKLGRLVSYSESGNYPMYAKMEYSAAAGSVRDSAPSPVLPAGENKISSNVNLVYEIK